MFNNQTDQGDETAGLEMEGLEEEGLERERLETGGCGKSLFIVYLFKPDLRNM
jgi:hypothetical protein